MREEGVREGKRETFSSPLLVSCQCAKWSTTECAICSSLDAWPSDKVSHMTLQSLSN